MDDWLTQQRPAGRPAHRAGPTPSTRARCSGRTRRRGPSSTAATPSPTGSAGASRRRRCRTSTNRTQADAEAALADAGLELGAVTPETERRRCRRASVIRQDPPAGEKVDKGSAVSIVVSTGPPSPSPYPDGEPLGGGGAQRLRHAVLARGAGARRARPHGGVPPEAQHRPAARHGGQREAGRRHGRARGVDRDCSSSPRSRRRPEPGSGRRPRETRKGRAAGSAARPFSYRAVRDPRPVSPGLRPSPGPGTTGR